MKVILEELFYNLKKSFFINIIIILQFCCFLWLMIEVGTYFIHITNNTWVVNAKNGYKYFTLMDAGDVDISDDPLHIENIKKVLNEVNKSDKYVYAITNDCSIPVSMETIKKIFGSESYKDFLYGSLYPGYLKEHPEDIPPVQESSGKEATELILWKMNENAVHHYLKNVKAGRLFEKEDYEVHVNKNERVCDMELPIILGAAYEPYVKVGDVIELWVYGWMNCRVIGILEDNTEYISDTTGELDGMPVTTADYSIIQPCFNISGTPRDEDLMFLEQNYTNQLQGTLIFDGGVSDEYAMREEEKINELYKANNLYTTYSKGATEGMKVFNGESRETVMIIVVLMVFMAVFSLLSLCIMLINKLNSNMNRYAIQTMNGLSPKSITLAYMLEIACIIFASFCVVIYEFKGEIEDNIQFLWLIIGLSIAVAIPAIVTMYIRLSSVDIEHMLKVKE
ncbi:MAG: hypothetical protein K6G65_05740 [Lachnospiraceae bacterium]|nr:hypothetical protein [Lachnospiraceae bacterium]